MSSGAATQPGGGLIESVGRFTLTSVSAVGDLALFAARMVRWLCAGVPSRRVMLPTLFQIGVQSIPVVMITGGFIGMVLAVQSYEQFRMMKLETRLGSIINISLVRELGPVLAATMLAGRVGSAIAAELGTMRVTEQIDALRALGANPVQYLVVPRFLACVLLIPLLTAVADAVGILGGWFFSTKILGINSFHYWYHSSNYVGAYDVLSGLFKSVFFGASIAIISCHRGFNCGAGAEGVGQAATDSFVYSFIVILIIDFFMGVFISTLYYLLWPAPVGLM